MKKDMSYLRLPHVIRPMTYPKILVVTIKPVMYIDTPEDKYLGDLSTWLVYIFHSFMEKRYRKARRC
jgi:DNA repair exonuclease SbcCD nuclease subunit